MVHSLGGIMKKAILFNDFILNNRYDCILPEQQGREDGEVTEREYLLMDIGDGASQEQKEELREYERYLNRYEE